MDTMKHAHLKINQQMPKNSRESGAFISGTGPDDCSRKSCHHDQ